MRILPDKPIHGFRFARLFVYALIDSGHLVARDYRKGMHYPIITEEFFQLTDDELEDILQKYLRKRDQ